MTEWAIRGEARDGRGAVTIRRGFWSQADAASYPVNESHWRRVWVEAVERKPSRPAAPEAPSRPPLDVVWEGGFAYLVDADGRKIASLLGSQSRREQVAALILDAVNAQ